MLNADRDKLIAAVKYVVADQRQGFTVETEPIDRVLVDRARHTLHIKGEEAGPANWEVAPEEGTPESYEAYCLVLRATVAELDYVFLSAWPGV